MEKSNESFELLNLHNKEWDIANGVLLGWSGSYKSIAERLRVLDGVTEIAVRAFELARVKSIILPKSVHTINTCAFQDSSHLQAVYIENPNVYLEKGCFYQLENLKCVVIGKNRFEVIVTQFDSDNCGDDVFCLERYVGNAREYYADDDIKVIACGAFSNCKTLEKVVLGKAVEELELYAFNFFEECFLREVILPKGLRIIGMGAFGGCNSIDELRIPQSVEIIEKDAFDDWEDWQKIYVPMHFKGAKNFQKWRRGCDAEIIYY